MNFFQNFLGEGWSEDDPELQKTLDEAGSAASSDLFERKIKEKLKKVYCNGDKLLDVLNMSKEKAAATYVDACRRYQNGKFDQAEQLFLLLYGLYPNEKKYSLGLAASQHRQEKYEQAVFSYNLVVATDPEDANVYYHLSDCWRHLNQPLATYNCLNLSWTAADLHRDKYGDLIPELDRQIEELEKELGIDPDEIAKLDPPPEEEALKLIEKVREGKAGPEETMEFLAKQKGLLHNQTDDAESES